MSLFCGHKMGTRLVVCLCVCLCTCVLWVQCGAHAVGCHVSVCSVCCPPLSCVCVCVCVCGSMSVAVQCGVVRWIVLGVTSACVCCVFCRSPLNPSCVYVCVCA